MRQVSSPFLKKGTQKLFSDKKATLLRSLAKQSVPLLSAAQSSASAACWLVYIAVNKVNKKFYIGYTGYLERRKTSHSRAARNGSPFPFHKAIRKHGWESFKFSVLEQFATEAEAMAAEKRLITERHPQDRHIGYNIADGGRGLGSEGAKAVHRRKTFRTALLASMPERHKKAQAVKLAEGTNRRAGLMAAETKRIRGISSIAARKAWATRRAKQATLFSPAATP